MPLALRYHAPYDRYPNLRRRMHGGRTRADWEWAEVNLREGLAYFRDVFGRYPSEREIDAFAYLPTARQVRRKFGGLTALRASLALPKAASRTGKKATPAPDAASTARRREALYQALVAHAGEARVHEQKRLRPSGLTFDFFVYTGPRIGIAIELLAVTDAMKAVLLASDREAAYKTLRTPVVLVVAGFGVRDARLTEALSARVSPSRSSVRVLAESVFLANLSTLIPTAE